MILFVQTVYIIHFWLNLHLISMNVRNKHLLLHNWGDIEQIIKENGLSGDFDLKMVKLSANS